MTRLSALKGDITEVGVDVLVNAANSGLRGGGGVDGAIHAAGGPSILEECRRLVEERGPVDTGNAVITGAGRLAARFVVHTVGPIWGRVSPEEADDLLASCYRESLELAAAHGCRSVAFSGISTGVFGFPKERACLVAVAAVREWTEANPDLIDDVVFVSFGASDHALYRGALG